MRKKKTVDSDLSNPSPSADAIKPAKRSTTRRSATVPAESPASESKSSEKSEIPIVVRKRGLFGGPIKPVSAKPPEPVVAKISPKRSRPKQAQPAASPVEAIVDPIGSKESAPKKVERSRAKRQVIAVPTTSVADELPIPVWRPVKKSVSDTPVPQSDVSEGEASQLAPRRSRSRRRREHRQMDISAGAVLGTVAEPKELEPEVRKKPTTRRTETPKRKESAEARPVRQVIPTPPDAPQIVMRNGVPSIVKDGRAIPPISFFGASLDERRLETVLDEIKRAGESGIHLFSHLVELTIDPKAVDEAVGFAGYLLNKTKAVDPDAQVILRIVFAAPTGWEQKYPKAKYVMPGGGTAEPSLCDDSLWKVAEECLTDFVQKARKLETADLILGVHLERGEWFFAGGAGYDTSPAALEKFRDWVKVRYRDDIVALRAAWFDGSAQFGTIAIPPYEKMAGENHEQFVRTGRKARRWVDYHLFLSDSTVERIGMLSHAAKKASGGYLLVCVDYGYTFEWSHPANGHLSLGKLLRNPDVDIICGPPSYKNREPGGSAPFPCPIDSFALNGKLYLSEEDFKTPISDRVEPDDFNPVMKTPQALESVHWRGVGAALAHMSGVSWMDTWGNGWLNTPGIWQRASEVRKMLERRLGLPAQDPDVAVFIDERSLAYLVDERAFNLLVQNVRESVLRSGMSVGFYLLSDLAHRENFPECRLHIFVNAWDIRPEVRSAIKSRLQCKDKVLFWLYAAGLFDGGRESLERVREVTGIALKPQPFASRSGSTLLNRKGALSEALPESLLSEGGELEPSYFAIPEDGQVLGEYSQTGLPSYVVREIHHSDPELRWKSVFLGEPIVTPALFRALGEMSGSHIWNFQDDVVHVRPNFLTIHCSGAGMRTIALPSKWSAFSVESNEWSATESTHLRFQATDGSTHTFLVGMRDDIEALLDMPTEELLRVEAIPPRTENTLHLDAIFFDVPIMKLGEWVEESWSDTMADDLMIKPSMLDLEPVVEREDSNGSNSGRRRRGGRRQRGGSEESADSRKEGIDRVPSVADLEMNVVFRKRE